MKEAYPTCARVGSGFRGQGSGCRVQGAGCRVQGAGFRVQGSGFVWACGTGALVHAIVEPDTNRLYEKGL